MNIFITGISGFSGFHLAHYFMEMGHHLYALTRAKDKEEEKKIEQKGDIDLIYGSLETLEALPPKIDVVIHTAAISPTQYTNTNDFIRDNILGTRTLVNLAKEHHVKKFIFFSSLSVYGDIKERVLTEETSIINPGAYGASKLLGEMCLKDSCDQMMGLAIRFPAIIGKGAKRHWLANTIQKAFLNQNINIFNPEAPFNNAIHIRELCYFIENLFSRSWNGFDAINIASSGSLTINTVVRTIIEKMHSSSCIIKEPYPKDHFTICTKKAEKNYGYHPISFAKALENYLSEEALIKNQTLS